MKRKVLITSSSILCGILLMSAAYPSGYTYYSSVAEISIPVVSVLASGSRTINQGANVTNNIAATFSVDYELLSMDKSTSLYTNYVPVYSLIYRVDIFLEDNVRYKGGVLNLLNGNNPCYINFIDVKSIFEGLTDIDYVVQTPNNESSNSSIRILEGVDPYNGYGTSDGNYMYLSNNNFETCNGIHSTSYSVGLDLIDDYNIDVYDDRIAARIESDEIVSGNMLEFNNKLTFGYDITKNSSGNYSATSKQYFSGPTKDDAPFYFTYYGAMNVESEVEPSNVSLTFTLNTTHGSSVLLDNFTDFVSLNIDVL